MISRVDDISQVGEARRAAVAFAEAAELSETQVGSIALLATELGTNLVKHGGGGEIIMDRFDDADGQGMELLALDKGPGMANLQRCLEDGYSTKGSPGTGLGAIARQSDCFAVFSRPGLGTAVVTRIVVKPSSPARASAQLGAVCATYPGESVCGDGWAFRASAPGRTLLVADGTGHGAQAARAADIATKTFLDNPDGDCVRQAEAIHRALAPTRGAATAIARIGAAEKLVRFVGIGNITGALVSGQDTRRMVSHNGTAGHIAPRIREFTYPFSETPVVILHSDGLSARWDLAAYPGLAASHPALIAGILYRDHRRGRDDATVVVMRGV